MNKKNDFNYFLMTIKNNFSKKINKNNFVIWNRRCLQIDFFQIPWILLLSTWLKSVQASNAQVPLAIDIIEHWLLQRIWPTSPGDARLLSLMPGWRTFRLSQRRCWRETDRNICLQDILFTIYPQLSSSKNNIRMHSPPLLILDKVV